MTLTELLESYITKRLKSGSTNTVRLYRHSIRSFEKTLGRQAKLDDLTDENIERHMWRIVNSGGSRASANKDHGQLTALWRFASHNRMTETWPNVRTLQEVEHVPLGWMPDECLRLIESARLEPGAINGVRASLWWECLLLVLFETGERIGAVRGLLHSHLQDRWLLIPAHLRKSNKRDKLYTLTPSTVLMLRDLICANRIDKKLFTWDRCETYIYNRYKSILHRAKLPDDRRSCFHRIRRTLCSAVAQAGGDASAALDHASPRTTRRYLDPRIVGGVSPSDIMQNFLRNPPPEKLAKKQA